MFIFDRCHCNCVAVTPVKYEHDSKLPMGTGGKYNNMTNGEINERSLDNPNIIIIVVWTPEEQLIHFGITTIIIIQHMVKASYLPIFTHSPNTYMATVQTRCGLLWVVAMDNQYVTWKQEPRIPYDPKFSNKGVMLILLTPMLRIFLQSPLSP